MKIALLIAAAFAVAACGKKQEPRQPREQPAVQKAKVKKKKKAKPAQDSAAKPASENGDRDERFISFDIDAENVFSGGEFSGSADIKAPFKNPFDSSEIAVELSVNGVSNGVSMNVPMHYERGNSDKSTWSFSTIIPKSGEYRYSISVRASGQNFFSPEFPLKASRGSGLGIYRLSKKRPSHFYLKGSENIRGIGANFPALLAGEAREKALDELAAAGANMLRVDISAPTALIVPSGPHAGKYNQPMLKNFGDLLASAQKRGMNVIVTFADDSDFGAAYAGSYFAKSGLAKTPDEFFSSPEAARVYGDLVKYVVNRFGSSKAIVMWEPFSGIDAFDPAGLDGRAAWLNAATSAARDSDATAKRPIMLTAATSGELEYLWGGDACAFLGFELGGLKDFSQGAWEHSAFFSGRYKKPAGAVSANPEAGAPHDPSFSHIRNSMWAGLMTGSPILPLADYGKVAARPAAAEAVAEISAFEKSFKTADADLEPLRLPEKIVQTSTSAEENSTIAYPAFSETFPERESSNDIARLDIDLTTGAISANTLPGVWKSEALIAVNAGGVPTDKNSLDIEIESVPADAVFDLVCLSNDSEVFRAKITPEGAKSVREKDGRRFAEINRKVSVPLAKGDNALTFRLDGANASMRVGRLEFPKTGSMRGVTSVKPFAARDKKTGTVYMWIRRAGAESSTIAKYRLYARGIPEIRPFEYSVKMEDAPSTRFKVTWWDTRGKKPIASGVLKTDAESVLKLKTPPFKSDVACVIERESQ